MRWPGTLLVAAALLSPVGARAAGSPQARFDALAGQARAAMPTDARAADALAARSLPLAEALPTERSRGIARATALWLQAEARYRNDDYAAATPLIAEARRLAALHFPQTKLEAEVLLTSGSVHGARAEVAPALIELQQAYTIFEKVGDARGQAISLICLSNLYNDAKDYDTALRYLREALDAYEADPKLAWTIHNNRGVFLQNIGRLGPADAEFTAAARLNRVLASPQRQLMLLRNQARNSLLRGRLTLAEQQIAAAQRLSSEAGGDDSILLALAAQAAFQRGKPAEAAKLITRAFAGVDLAATPMIMREAHRTGFEVFRALGRPDQALAHLTAWKRLDDQATRLATETSSALMAARFDSANQEAKIAQLRDAERLRVAREALQRAETERTLFLLGGGAAVVIMALLAIGLVVLRRSRDQVRAAAADLAVTNGALGKALAAKTEFLATTSHEIRTPLNGILGMTQVMLADASLPAVTRDRLTVVHGAGVTMRALVDDILDVAKMETGNLGLECAPFDLAATVREATVLWAEQARAKGLAFQVDLARCPGLVEGDAARVRQIVFNLLSNALKFTEAGAIGVVAEATDGGVRIAVSDTGIGIAPDQQGAVFESFRQADASTTRRFGGTGLGLSICRNLAQAMGGDITLASAVNTGSTFTVVLPLQCVDAAPLTPSVNEERAGLLIVDRNPITRAMLRTLMLPHAGTVVCAATPAEVADALAAARPARVLLDHGTALASGDPLGFVAATVAAAADVPVVLLWPIAAAAERAALLALGVERVIAKPITGAALLADMFPTESSDCSDLALVSQAA